MTERTPLVLAPGLLCDEALWAHQVRYLDDMADMRVADFTTQDDLADMARQVLDIAPASEFALAGLSMGGYVALEVMRQAPEQVTRLALIDTAARPETEEQTRRRKDLIGLAGMGRFKGVTPRLLPMLVHEDRLEEEALVGPIMAMAERVGTDAFIRQQTAIMNRPDSRPGLADIACPTLVMCGRQDILTPPDASAEMAAAIPDAALVVVEDCAHMSTMERPEAATAVLRYWLQR